MHIRSMFGLALALAAVASCKPEPTRVEYPAGSASAAAIATQAEYFATHPPSMLSEYAFERFEGAFESGGHAEPINIAYKVRPKGAPAEFEFVATSDPELPGTPTDPIYIRPAGVDEDRLFFATWLHGYDGEHGHLGDGSSRNGKPSWVKKIKSNEALVIAFHYPDDLFESQTDDQRQPKPEDLFTWISFWLVNDAGQMTPLLDFECA